MRYYNEEVRKSDGIHSRLNGQIVIAEEDILPYSIGKGNLDLKIWSIRSKEAIKIGETVEITGYDSGVLWVKKIKNISEYTFLSSNGSKKI
ncbi:NfeD family protein [Halosquirtibacter laminarini]